MRFILALAILLALTGCDGGTSSDADTSPTDATDAQLASWTCPADWVATARGGCGPAVVLCMPDSGAAPGACGGVDVHARREVASPDGGVGTPLYRAADGRFAGGWHDEGDPAGYPPSDWTPDAGNGTTGDSWRPDAGIPTCPDGWTRRTDGSCDPVLRVDCPVGASPLPGGACTLTTTSDCPAGPYADPGAAAIGATVVHVAAGADPAAADGSELHPFATIAAGVTAAGAGGFVLVAGGRYDDVIDATNDTHVLGACAARVTWSPTGDGPAIATHDAARTIEIAGIAFEGPGNVSSADGGARVIVRDVTVSGTRGPAFAISGASTVLEVDDLAAHDLAPVAPDTASAFATVRAGAHLEVSRSSIARAVENAIDAAGAGSQVTLTESAVVDITAGSTGRESAMTIHDGAAAQLDRVAVRNNPVRGLTVVTGGEAMLHDVAFERTGSTTASGFPLWVVGARMDAQRISVRDVDGNALEMSDADVHLADSLVADIRPSIRSLDDSGWGILALGCRIRIERTWVHDTSNFGALIGSTDRNDTTSYAVLDGMVSERVRRGTTSGTAVAIAFSGMPQVTGRHLLARAARDSGISVGSGTVGTFSDVVARDDIGAPDFMGFGFLAMEGSHVTVNDIATSHVQGVAIASVGMGTQLDVDHAYAGHNTVPIVGGFPQGASIAVISGGHATLRHLRIEDAQLFGIVLAKSDDLETEVVLEDSAIIGTTPVFSAQVQNILGGGAGGSDETHLVIRRTLIERASPMAVFAGAGARLEISDSAVRSTLTTNRGLSSAALFAFNDAVLQADRVLVESAENTGIISYTNATIDWSDGVLAGVAADEFGFGTGVNASGDGRVVLDRVAVLDTHGAALMASPFQDPTTPRQTGASIVARDLYVRGVGVSPIRVDYDTHDQPVRVSTEVAYGLHAGSMCSLDVSRGVVLDAGYGFYASSGTLAMHDGVLGDMHNAAGARSAANPVLERVGFVSNATDAVEERMDLPEGAMLRAPSSSCANPACL